MNSSLTIYHEIEAEQLGAILTNGIKRTSRGSKGDDKLIIKTDFLLDAYRPQNIRAIALSRNTVVYGYVGTSEYIIDIKDGRKISLRQKILDNRHALLQLSVHTELCYVSDLNRYDNIKNAVQESWTETRLQPLILEYWQNLIPLEAYSTNGTIKRPEVMIPHDIMPTSLRIMSLD